MRFQSNYEEWPLSAELGEAPLQLDHVRDHYLIHFDGREFTGGHYEGNSIGIYRLAQDGEVRGISGALNAIVPEYPGSIDPEAQRRVELGLVSAQYYVEDRALAIHGSAHRLTEDDQVELGILFERYAKRRFSQATTLYRLQRTQTEEPILRRLGYRLLRENRRKPSGLRDPHPIRTWAK